MQIQDIARSNAEELAHIHEITRCYNGKYISFLIVDNFLDTLLFISLEIRKQHRQLPIERINTKSLDDIRLHK